MLKGVFAQEKKNKQKRLAHHALVKLQSRNSANLICNIWHLIEGSRKKKELNLDNWHLEGYERKSSKNGHGNWRIRKITLNTEISMDSAEKKETKKRYCEKSRLIGFQIYN